MDTKNKKKDKKKAKIIATGVLAFFLCLFMLFPVVATLIAYLLPR